MTRWNDERGSITAFVAVVATALVMVAGMAQPPVSRRTTASVAMHWGA